MSVGSPFKSTFGESFYTFESPSPAKDQIFETRLCQLLQALSAPESYSPYEFHQGIFWDQGVNCGTIQPVSSVYTVQTMVSTEQFEVNHPTKVSELCQEQVAAGRVNLPFEVSH